MLKKKLLYFLSIPLATKYIHRKWVTVRRHISDFGIVAAISAFFFGIGVATWGHRAYGPPIWHAWTAIITGAGILIALLGPTVRRKFASRRTTGIFVFSHYHNLLKTFTRLQWFVDESDVGLNTKQAELAHRAIMNSDQVRVEFIMRFEPIREFAGTEVDLSKWPDSINLNVAYQIAGAIQYCRAMGVGLEELQTQHRDISDVPQFFSLFRERAGITRSVISDALDYIAPYLTD